WSRNLGIGARAQIGEGDVVDGDLHSLGHSPILGVLVEPDVVGGDEVAPLDDLQGLLGASDPNRGAERGYSDGRPRRRDELAPIDSLPLGHGPSSVCAAPSAVHGGTKSLRRSVAARRHGDAAGATYGSVRAKSHIKNRTTGRCTRSCTAA